ncbi:hypothetical protein [Candidatus Thiosymbion oneisti]|uniref:hypothetical protein n=1 Tax=Candidatus Thiosymbion oneisti TaxID=589554 RepID=UPI000B7DD7DE|nr:hypothetical protein [Candidatus Thiosymbion oneisti]
MALNTTIIKKRLASVPRIQKDNEAQNIINQAKTAELKSLNTEGVLRLYEALTSGFYSARDAAAMKRLATYTQFQPVTYTPDYVVNLVKGTRLNQPNIQSQLTPGLVTRIYAAEGKRLAWYASFGFDGSTVGRGQLGQSAYTDVKSPRYFKTTLETCVTQVFLAKLLRKYPGVTRMDLDLKSYKVKVPELYARIWPHLSLENFVVTAYLAILIARATKTGRSPKDTARFAVALYHGMYKMVVAVQMTLKENERIHWAPVEAELLKQGHTDEVAYVKEVVK